jgi:hypothetical protein
LVKKIVQQTKVSVENPSPDHGCRYRWNYHWKEDRGSEERTTWDVTNQDQCEDQTEQDSRGDSAKHEPKSIPEDQMEGFVREEQFGEIPQANERWFRKHVPFEETQNGREHDCTKDEYRETYESRK